LLVQQNIYGFHSFNRSWVEFKVGFNESSGGYWLGNDQLSQLTMTNRYKLRFDLQSRSNPSNWYYAEYSSFMVLPEAFNYELKVAGYSGNAGFDAFGFHNGMMFTTRDRDNDEHPTVNCAITTGGGFWYNRCLRCGVNVYYGRASVRNFTWEKLPGGWDLQTSRMWLLSK